MASELNVLLLASEAVPFAKTGGLADVVGALPPALKRLGADVRLVLPMYRSVLEGKPDIRPRLKRLQVPLGHEMLEAGVFEGRIKKGIPVYLIEREDLYDRPNLYGDARGDYHDNLERFAFLAHAALRLAGALPFRPDVIHCHDWQSGLLPPLLKGPYATAPSLGKTVTVFTIHNLGYQGIFPADKFPLTGLASKEFFHPEGLEFWGNLSLLKAGIVYSEAVTTVSPTYALEIQTPEHGMGMEGLLGRRKADLMGFLNGVDYRIWNPATDVHIPFKYSPGKMEGKGRCKLELIREMGLDPLLKSRPLLGVISRLDVHKGLDLLVKVLNKILSLDVGVVLLGSGDRHIQKDLQRIAKRHSGRVAFETGFNEPLAHRIMAASDLFLIPSQYEPCGLTQMYALKYGAVPIVRATGGLEDTIVRFDPDRGKGNGFKFTEYEPAAFLKEVRKAVEHYRDAAAWKGLMKRGMKADFSWDRSARRYMELYRAISEKALNRG